MFSIFLHCVCCITVTRWGGSGEIEAHLRH